MNDFLAAIVTAAQTPPASPMIQPLLAPHFAPLPPIAGDGLAAGGDGGDPLFGPAGMAEAAAPDALDIIPPLLPLGDYDGDTVYLPWPEAEAPAFAGGPGAPANPEASNRSIISQPIVADAGAGETPGAAGDAFDRSRTSLAPDDRHAPVHRNSPPEAMRDGAISRAAPHVAGDTNEDENRNAENLPRTFGHDADAAEDADRLRFHPRPSRRQRSPRPVFGLDTHAARGATTLTDENATTVSGQQSAVGIFQADAHAASAATADENRNADDADRTGFHPHSPRRLRRPRPVFRADAHPAPVAMTDEDRTPGRGPASSVTAMPPAKASLQRRVLAAADAAGAPSTAVSNPDPARPPERISYRVLPAVTTAAADTERSSGITESSHLLVPAPDLARPRPLASEVSAALQRKQGGPSLDPERARATQAAPVSPRRRADTRETTAVHGDRQPDQPQRDAATQSSPRDSAIEARSGSPTTEGSGATMPEATGPRALTGSATRATPKLSARAPLEAAKASPATRSEIWPAGTRRAGLVPMRAQAGEATRHAISGHTAEAASPTSEQGAKPATRELAAPTMVTVAPGTHGARAGVRPSVSAPPGMEPTASAPLIAGRETNTAPAMRVAHVTLTGSEMPRATSAGMPTADEHVTQAGSLRHAPMSRIDIHAARGATADENVRSNDFSRSPRATATEVATTNRSIFRAGDGLATPAATSGTTQAPSIIRPAPEAPAAVASRTVASGPSQAQEPAPAEPLPTIRVTIGRIEVHSSMPLHPPATSQASRPRPGLSLDDYLKRPARARP